MVCKSAAPNLGVRSELLFRAKRESAFDELNCAFQRRRGRDEQMKMIGHQDKFVKEIRISAMAEKHFEKQASPRLRVEERPTFPRVRGDEVDLRVVGCVFASRLQNRPSAAKAAAFYTFVRHG
jgi:hypothetical protein